MRFLVILQLVWLAGCPPQSSPVETPDAPEHPDASGLPPGFSAPSPFGDSSTESIELRGSTGLAAVSDGSRGVYRTDDGGQSWQPLGPDLDAFGAAASPSGATVWLIGSGHAFASIDHGASFEPLATLPSDFHGRAYLWDDTTGLVTSETGDRVYRTANGGATWDLSTFTRDVLPGTHRFATWQDDIWLVGGPSFHRDGAHVAHSPDHGATWETFQLTTTGTGPGGELLGGAAVSATELWVVGEGAQVYHTIDAFKTWQQVTALPSDVFAVCAAMVQGGVIRLAATSTDHQYGILESHDGASFTWVAKLPPPTPAFDGDGIKGMTALSAGGYVIYGYAGLYYVHS